MIQRLGLACLVSWTLTAPASFASDRAILFDRWDRPVRDANGERIEHAGPRDEPWSLPPSLDPPPSRAPRSFDPALMIDDATIGNYVQDLGTKGIHAVDTDSDGIPEIVVGHGSMWYLLAFDATRHAWVQRYFHEYSTSSTFGGGAISDVRVGDVDADGAPEVVVLTGSGTLDSYDARTGRLEGTQSLGVTNVVDFELADVEGLVEDEVVLVLASELRVYRVGTVAPVWTLPGVGGSDLAVGNVDGDAAKEIVIAGSGAGQVVDAATRTTEWAYSTGFGSIVDVGDIDGDGLDEIAGCGAWGACLAVDGDTRVEKWSFDNFNTGAIRCRDVNGDGIPEVGLGDAQWGDVHFHEGISGGLVSSVPNPEHSVAYIDWADVDGDCAGEVIWGAGYSSTGEDHLFVADHESGVIEWKNIENDGPMHAFVIADVDADGETEIVRACSESDAGYGGTLIHVTDLHRRHDEYLPTAELSMNWIPTQGMAVVQADADPQLEYVVSTSFTYDGFVGAHDGITHERQWMSVMLDDGSPRVIATGDPDADGDEDILLGTGSYWRILQATDGAVLYRSPNVGSVFGIKALDADADGQTEVVIASATGIRILDGVTRFEEWFRADADLGGFDVADVVPGGAPEILSGDATGMLFAHDGAAPHAEVFRVALGAGAIHAIRAGDVDGDGIIEIVVSKTVSASSPQSHLQVVRVSDRSVAWTSPPIVGSAGLGMSLYIQDADDDGQNEIAVSGTHVLRFFEHDNGVADGAAPVFSGLGEATSITAASCCPTVQLSWEPARDARTPPITYRVHRGMAAGFPIDATSLIATTDRTSHRDERVLPATTYWYAVRAVDAAGNEDANVVRLSFETVDASPPAAPAIASVTDADPCLPSGVDIVFVPATPPAGTRFDLLRDGIPVRFDVTSPLVYVPGNALDHSYAIVATKLACNIQATGPASTARDEGAAPPAATIASVTDLDPCVPTGVRVTFTHPGFGPGGGSFDLLRDGAIVETNVTSPADHVPPDSASHGYVIRAIDAACMASTDSSPRSLADGSRVPEAPSAVTIEDVDPCAPSSARLRFTHAGFAIAGHYELWRDGIVFLSPVTSGQVFPLFDPSMHDYTVVAVEDSCVLQAVSVAVPFADGVSCEVGDPSIRVRVFDPSEVEVTWAPVSGDIVRYDAYVGTLASLWGARAYDHVADRAGLTFPDAASITSGCDVSAGTSPAGKIRGLASGDYVLVVAVSGSLGAGPFGPRSDGIDRHDPSVDPRPPATFCP